VAVENWKPVPCRSCNSSMVFLKTASGKRIPVDATDYAIRQSKAGEVFDQSDKGLVPHHGTCPQGREWSRGRK